MARFTRGFQPALPTDVEEQTRPRDSRPAGGPKPFPNKFGAKCVVCGVYVQAGAGETTKNNGKWEVRHVQPCPTAEQAAEAAAPSGEFKVPTGRYTVVWGDHYKTIRVEKQDEFDDFMPGVTLLKYLSGPSNESDYTGFAHVDARTGEVRFWKKHRDNEVLREAVKVLLGDPKAASQAYAVESNRCSRCNHPLTVPASVHAGLGPDCAKKVAW